MEVRINVTDAEPEAGVRTLLGAAKVTERNVYCHHNPTNDAWCRDHGPIFDVCIAMVAEVVIVLLEKVSPCGD